MDNYNDTGFNYRISLCEELLNSLPVSILLLDLQGVVRFINKSALVTLGYHDGSQLIGGRFRDVLKSSTISSSLDAGCDNCMVTATIQAGGCYTCKDELIVSTEGELLPISFSAVPLLDSSGLLTGEIITFIDLTREKVFERQLEQIRNFEKFGSDITGVVHDFNNILTSIVGFATLLEMQLSADDGLVKNVRQILAASERAAGLIRSLTALNRNKLTEAQLNPKTNEAESLSQLRDN